MTQSYFAYRAGKIGRVILVPFLWIFRIVVSIAEGFLTFVMDLFPFSVMLLVAVGGLILAILSGFGIGPWKSHVLKPRPTVSASIEMPAIQVVSSAPTPAPTPEPAGPVRLMKVIRTGVRGVNILEDEQSGCQYIVIVGRPPVLRQNSDSNGYMPWCLQTPPVPKDAQVPDKQHDIDGGIF
jgi:hypothetical protein